MKKAFILLSLLLLFSCATTEPLTLEPWPLEGNEVLIDRGQAVLSASDGEVRVSAALTLTSDEEWLCVTAVIENLSDERYLFDDAQIVLYSGDRDTGLWTESMTWDAARFYSFEKDAAERRQNTANAVGAVVVFSSWVDAAAGPGPGPRGGRPAPQRHPSPAGRAVATTIIASNEMAAVARQNDNYLSFLENNLLFDSHIAPGESYEGVLYLAPDWKKPDYKLVFRSKDGTELSFIYSRSDRATMKR